MPRNLSAVDLGDAVAALVTAALLIVAGLGLTGVGRLALALVFVTFVPGWAVLDYVPLGTGPWRAALAAALSLALSTVAAASAVWLHVWHTRVMLDVAGCLCLLAVVWHLAHPRPRQ